MSIDPYMAELPVRPGPAGGSWVYTGPPLVMGANDMAFYARQFLVCHSYATLAELPAAYRAEAQEYLDDPDDDPEYAEGEAEMNNLHADLIERLLQYPPSVLGTFWRLLVADHPVEEAFQAAVAAES